MSNDNVVLLIQPGTIEDQLTEVLRSGARALLAQAIEAEVAAFLGKQADLKTEQGHQRVVRHGHLPEREVMIGIGPVRVRQPRVGDREATASDPARIRFSPPFEFARSRSRRCCRSCTSRAFRPALSRKHWRRCSAKTLPVCPHMPSAALRMVGRTIMPLGRKRCSAPTFRLGSGCGVVPAHERSI